MIVQEKNGEAIKGENLLQEVSLENSSARIYIGNKFTLETNWKLKKVFMTLQQQPGIELVCKKPYMFRWNEDLVLPSEESEALSGKKSSYENLTSSIGQVNQVDHKETIIYATSASVDQKDPVAMFSGSLFFSDTPQIPQMVEPKTQDEPPTLFKCDNQKELGEGPSQPDNAGYYMTGTFTTELYLMDVDGSYGQVS